MESLGAVFASKFSANLLHQQLPGFLERSATTLAMTISSFLRVRASLATAKCVLEVGVFMGYIMEFDAYGILMGFACVSEC